MGREDGFGYGAGGHGAFVALPEAGPPELHVKVAYLPGIPDRVMVDPEDALVKGRDMSPESALGATKDGGFEYAFLGSEKPGVPVRFPGRFYPED
jgi:hypothetical protein